MNEQSHSFHQQRSVGKISLSVTARGLQRMREEGSAKVRFPHTGREAILINTGGGLAGGDDFTFDIEVGLARISLSLRRLQPRFKVQAPWPHWCALPLIVKTTWKLCAKQLVQVARLRSGMASWLQG